MTPQVYSSGSSEDCVFIVQRKLRKKWLTQNGISWTHWVTKILERLDCTFLFPLEDNRQRALYAATNSQSPVLHFVLETNDPASKWCLRETSRKINFDCTLWVETKQQTHGWRYAFYGDLSLKRRQPKKSNNEQRGFQSFFLCRKFALILCGVKQMIIYAAVWHGRFSSFFFSQWLPIRHQYFHIQSRVSMTFYTFSDSQLIRWFLPWIKILQGNYAQVFFRAPRKKYWMGKMSVSAAFQTFVRK